MVARCAAAAPVLSANFVLWNTLEKGQVNHFPLVSKLNYAISIPLLSRHRH